MSDPVDNALELIRERHVYSVSRLNREARGLLEEGLGTLWVEGEISSLARPSSGHLYFSLKDANAQVRCAMFRQHNRRLGFRPEDGQQVLLTARVSLYEARGDYQLIVEHMEASGEGLLRQRFEELKRRLAAEGLFADAIKRPIPVLPRRIGVITSPTGAALHDILTTLARRFPAVPVRVYPTAVQGAGAPAEFVAALELADRRRDCDVLILARGGGGLEDLLAFNDEAVARAIRACGVPVVAGVGHEVDVTIADFAADLRAPTPTGAAERVVPDQGEWLRLVGQSTGRLHRAVTRQLQRRTERLDALAHRLQRMHPGHRLRQDFQALDGLERRLGSALRTVLTDRRHRLQRARGVLQQHSPARRLLELRHRHEALQSRLGAAVRTRLQQDGQRLAVSARGLHAVSPLATLERGYAITTRADGTVVRDARELTAGEPLTLRLRRGLADVQVTATRDNTSQRPHPDAEPDG